MKRQRFFMQHDDDVTAISAHPDQNLIASAQCGGGGGKSASILIWDSKALIIKKRKLAWKLFNYLDRYQKGYLDKRDVLFAITRACTDSNYQTNITEYIKKFKILKKLFKPKTFNKSYNDIVKYYNTVANGKIIITWECFLKYIYNNYTPNLNEAVCYKCYKSHG